MLPAFLVHSYILIFSSHGFVFLFSCFAMAAQEMFLLPVGSLFLAAYEHHEDLIQKAMLGLLIPETKIIAAVNHPATTHILSIDYLF